MTPFVLAIGPGGVIIPAREESENALVYEVGVGRPPQMEWKSLVLP